MYYTAFMAIDYTVGTFQGKKLLFTYKNVHYHYYNTISRFFSRLAVQKDCNK